MPMPMTEYVMRRAVMMCSIIVILGGGIQIEGAHDVDEVEYSVSNTALTTGGGVRFCHEVGAGYAKQTLRSATQFTWRLFNQNQKGERKKVQKVSLIVEDIDGVAYASNNEIHLSARYVGNYSAGRGSVKTEVTGVLYHEMTHIWQWDGRQEAPGGLIEGIADFVRLKAGYAPSHWVKPGQGQRWDQGYDVTAYFLDYCNTLRVGFVAQLNSKMRDGYSTQYFDQLLGKTVDQLWNDYKAKFGN